ncbi:hypothetical protein [Blastochloris tepida]|uniref:hypothetical protein n=1 Tax=Blastochloris tepida TaxID=2233851 RepID=UPI000F819D09|nr:hypothetical protein [Blastochloris tepida]
MSQVEEKSVFDDLSALIKESFPDLRCLRCGHDKFYLLEENIYLAKQDGSLFRKEINIFKAERPSITTLACARCGHLESHMTEILVSAPKPIPRE